MCPGNHESAGKRRTGKARKGNAALRTALTEAAWTTACTRIYPGSQYRRFCRRFGKKAEAKAAFAVGHTLLVIIWHVLHNDVYYVELGPDFLDTRNDSKQRERYLIRQLEALGHKSRSTPPPDHRQTTARAEARAAETCRGDDEFRLRRGARPLPAPTHARRRQCERPPGPTEERRA